MWLMLQQPDPDDYVIATGQTHSVKEFVEKAFQYVDRPIKWEGEGVNEIGKDAETGKILVRVNPRYFRPTEVVTFLFSITFLCSIAIYENIRDFK